MHLKRTLCNMTGIAREILANFEGLASQKGIELRLEAASDVIEVYLDRDKFIQVLTNLVGNAIKFTSVGYVRISLRELEGFAECKVSDTGRGISGEDLSRVFEKFRQFGRAVGPGIGGTGLGLSICKKLIELHHGKISIDSYPLKGTSVTVLLPKYTSREIFREHIAQALNRCAEEGGTLSLIIFDIVDFETVKRTLGEGHVREIVAKIEKLMNDSLRRAADVAIRTPKRSSSSFRTRKRERVHRARPSLPASRGIPRPDQPRLRDRDPLERRNLPRGRPDGRRYPEQDL